MARKSRLTPDEIALFEAGGIGHRGYSPREDVVESEPDVAPPGPGPVSLSEESSAQSRTIRSAFPAWRISVRRLWPGSEKPGE